MKRVIIITGASSGLGSEFARQLAAEREANEIWLIARRKDRLDRLSDELEKSREKGARTAAPMPRTFEIDLGKRSGIKALDDLISRESVACGLDGFAIDAFVNNAGFGTYGTFMGTDAQRQLDMIDLNVHALTGLCHQAIPYMAKGSLLINVASLASFAPLGNFAVYGATKAYVLSFTMALAAEVADSGIFVAALCPGPVDTEFANVASNGAREKVVDGKSPEAVVWHCLRQIKKGKRIAIMAPKWKIKAFMSRFIGRYWFARRSYVHDKRPSR